MVSSRLLRPYTSFGMHLLLPSHLSQTPFPMNPQTPPCTHVNVRFLHGRFRLLEEEEEGRREGDSRKQVGGSEGLKDFSFRLVGASCLPPSLCTIVTITVFY